MNRIILIGNGFDLAHDLKTSYKNFIDDYWKNVIDELKKQAETFKNSTSNHDFITKQFSVYAGKSFIDEIIKNQINYDFIKDNLENSIRNFVTNKNKIGSYNFKNNFLQRISYKNSLKNWVDIEEEYYSCLKEILKNEKLEEIEKLNEDFKEIQDLLVEYLKKIDISKINFDFERFLGEKIFEKINLSDLNNNSIKELSTKVSDILYNRKTSNLIVKNQIDIQSLKLGSESIEVKIKKNEIEIFSKNICFLTFNYTNTHRHYDSIVNKVYKEKNIESFEIKIHGDLNSLEQHPMPVGVSYSSEQKYNPIIFGYGDELDEKYKEIEKLNNNRFLENIKSIKYSETDNYKKLLEFIESDTYQVYIFGHSCGTSDRTLLNTLFEHDNCVSIKPFYYINKERKDNYSDLVRNISRNFNDKTKMRSRVVNKTYCKSFYN